MRRFPALVLAIGLLMAACGSASTAGNPTATVTLSPTGTTIPVIPNDTLIACYGSPTLPIGTVAVGDLLITGRNARLSYPHLQLKDGIDSTKPYQLSGSPTTTPSFVGSFVDGPIINAYGSATDPLLGLGLTICNTGPDTTIDGLQAKVTSYTPYVGTVNEWGPACGGTYYSPTAGLGGGAGCGGAKVVDHELLASISSNVNAGDVVPFTYEPDGTAPLYPMSVPNSVTASQTFEVDLMAQVKSSYGTYSFQIGLATGGKQYFSTITVSQFLTTARREWTGNSCEAAPYSTQLTDSAANYICPA